MEGRSTFEEDLVILKNWQKGDKTEKNCDLYSEKAFFAVLYRSEMKKTLHLHLELVRFVKNIVSKSKNGDLASFKNLYLQKLKSENS